MIKPATRRTSRRSATVTARSAKAKSSSKQDNGLVGSILSTDEIDAVPAPAGARSRALTARGAAAPARLARAVSPTPVTKLDPEATARQCLERALERRDTSSSSRVRPAAAARQPAAGDPGKAEYKSLGAEAVPLTGTTMVKFRQTFNKIPVYGSLVSVEIDKKNRCLGINSSLGTPRGVRHIAKVSPDKALAVAAKASGQPKSQLGNTPQLHYYFHTDAAWHLAYIVENVKQRKRAALGGGHSDALLKDYVVDAHSGRLLAALPRTSTMASVTEQARDGLRANRRIVVETKSGGKRELHDAVLNLTTYDFGFKDPSRQSRLLPGVIESAPPTPWPVEAVAAHANGAEVARFLRGVLKRNNIDNRGGEMISSVNCWDRADSDSDSPAREWRNAFWNDTQMVYGQVLFPDGSFYSIANMLDIVGHEMFHGVTDRTSRLEYQVQPGALNESYSDIFGTIIANYRKPIARWQWNLGTDFDGKGTVLRSMKDPTLHEQPKLMKHFKRSTPPYTYDRNDYGHVHDNSGIHNFAAYRVMTAKNVGKYVFTPRELAALFYIALTQHLSRTSLFTDSRRAVVQAATSLFRNNSKAARDRKVKAVEAGFDAAGIA
jgi:Zn-dependent metalloprotease